MIENNTRDNMHVPIPYSKQEVEDAFYNVLLLAKEQANTNRVDGFECADDFIAEKSINIIEYIQDMINNTPEDAPDLSK